MLRVINSAQKKKKKRIPVFRSTLVNTTRGARDSTPDQVHQVRHNRPTTNLIESWIANNRLIPRISYHLFVYPLVKPIPH